MTRRVLGYARGGYESDLLCVNYSAGSTRPVIVVVNERERSTARIEVDSGDVVDGSLRHSVRTAVCDWIDAHREEIKRVWRLWVSGKVPGEISGAVGWVARG